VKRNSLSYPWRVTAPYTQNSADTSISIRFVHRPVINKIWPRLGQRSAGVSSHHGEESEAKIEDLYGCGGGVGRPLGVASVLGVGVGLGVEVGVGVAVPADVAVGVGVGVSDGVAVAVLFCPPRRVFGVPPLRGPTLFRALLERGFIDHLNLTIAPYMFGGGKAPTLTGLSKEFLPASVHCSLIEMRTVGDECFLTYRIKHE